MGAAALKAVDLTNRPAGVGWGLASHTAAALAIEAEIVLGLLVLLGVWKAVVMRLAAAAFFAFACVSLYKLLTGAPTCGCLGSYSVPPSCMLVIDLAAAVALMSSRPPWGAGSFAAVRQVLFAVGLVCGTAGLVRSMEHWQSQYEFHEGSRWEVFPHAIRDFAALAPGDWAGRTLPIGEHVDIWRKLQRGKWVVLLYRANCAECSQLIRAYFDEGNRALGAPDDHQTALIEVGFARRAEPIPEKWGETPRRPLLGRLDDSRRWVVHTPTVLLLSDGIVVRAREEFGSS